MSTARKRGSRERTCSCCGKVDLVRQDNKSERCVSCSSKANASTSAAVAAASARRNRVTLTCSCCSAQFQRVASACLSREVFCSVQCRRLHQSVGRCCKLCGSSFRVNRSVAAGRTNASGNFCSRPCYERWLCRTGRVTGRGSQWLKIRTKVKAAAPFCGLCGRVACQLQVHHVVPFRLSFDNDNMNLIPLCVRCHKRVEMTTVEVEGIVGNNSDIAKIMNTLLRFRQAATFQILRKLANERF